MPNIGTGFEEPALESRRYDRGTNAPGVELGFTGNGGPGIADFQGDQAYLLNQSALHLETELVDTRNFADVAVSIDVRTWEDSERFVFDNISITATPVPEPSAGVLAALAMLGLGACGWRRRR